MIAIHSLALSLVPLLGCVAPAGFASPRAQDAPAAEDFRPLQFGDPPGELAYDEPFFPGEDPDPAITPPETILGQAHGTRLSHHEEILACFRAWDEESPRLRLESIGRTHEGRELVVAVITSPANQARLETIRRNLARLRDPRGLSEAEARRLIDQTPPVAWLGYSIHGDELSGADAAVALGYHLAADRSERTRALLERIVVVIDPCMNPDGRERIIGMTEQAAGYTPNLDYEGMRRGRWPFGRGNHYLFDMNRDWIAGTQPETRARWRAALTWHPQLFVDAHEMGSLDTFLFYPQAAPIHPNFQPRHLEWQKRFAAGIAAAFDRFGWGYYTREWADGWAPFYSDAWGSLIGAVGILYEQARTAGTPLRRESGEVLTYREAVHHQATASLASLETLAAVRTEILADYLAQARRNVAADTPGNGRLFVVRPGANDERTRELVRILLQQGIEVLRTREAARLGEAASARGVRAEELELPAGALVVSPRQPQGQLVHAFLDFDPRMSAEELRSEREELERKGSSKIYDTTAWSLAHALDLDAWWCDAAEIDTERVGAIPAAEGGVVTRAQTAKPVYAWVVDGASDRSVRFAARAMEHGLFLHFAEKPFTAAGRRFPRGSLLVRRHENDWDGKDVAALVARAAREAGVRAFETTTGRSPDEGPDLGGGHFLALRRPRVAILAGSPVSPDTYGHLWHELDRAIGVPFTILEAQALGRYDLRRYDVLIAPPGAFSGSSARWKSALEDWVEGGGTLIACGSSAAALTREAAGLSRVVLRRDALDEIERYRAVAERERAAREIEVDETLVWGEGPTAGGDEQEDASGADARADEGAESSGEDEEDEAPAGPKGETPEELDAWRRRFFPRGVFLRGEVRPEAWITAGCGEELPVFCDTSNVLFAPRGVETAVRLAPAERLRLSGLVWPEARERLADSAWLTVEGRGRGQVVLFSSMPAFRGFHRGTARLFANAVVYGPGLGANLPNPR